MFLTSGWRLRFASASNPSRNWVPWYSNRCGWTSNPISAGIFMDRSWNLPRA
jgi:hypothetical protein